MASDHRSVRRSIQSKYSRVSRYATNKPGVCDLCGKPRDQWGHDDQACGEKWLAEQDTNGNPSNRRGQ